MGLWAYFRGAAAQWENFSVPWWDWKIEILKLKWGLK